MICHSEDRSGSSPSSRPTPVPPHPLEDLLGTIPQGTCVPLHPLALPSGAAGIATIISPRTRGTPSRRLSASSPTLLLSPPAKYVILNRQDVTAVSKARLQRSPPAKTWYTQPKSLSFNVCSGIWKGRGDMSFMVIVSSFFEWEGPGWYFFCLPWKPFCNGFSVKEMAHHRLRFH